MEADEYFQAYEALKEDDSPGRVTLKVNDPCGITKIVWSSFDFMTGPELKFVWEVIPSNAPPTPVNLSGEEGSVIDTESLDSSVSAASGQFEDIDDPLKSDLITAAVSDPFGEVTVETGFDLYSSSPLTGLNFHGGVHYLDEYMTDSRSTIATTVTINGDDSRLLESPASSTRLDNSGSSYDLQDFTESAKKVQLSQNVVPVDPMSGTPVDSMDISNILNQNNIGTVADNTIHNQEVTDRRTGSDSNSSTVTVLTNDSSFGPVDEREAVDLKVSEDCSKQNAMITSFVDSGIVGTISTHSDLSALCQSPAALRRSMLERSLMEASIFRPSSFDHDDDTLLDIDVPLDYSEEQPSDEVFVAKFVLAEQICSTQMPSHPLLHKMTVVPAKSLLAASFLFSLQTRDQTTMHAISFLMGHKRLDWYMHREKTIENMMTDIVPRLKASMLTEDNEDVIVRITSELTRFLELFGSLERFSLVAPGVNLKIRQTLLDGRSVGEDKFLAKAISGTLQSQGYTVVIGHDHAFVAKLLTTLSLFIPNDLRWCSIRAYRHKYNPYLRLQAVRRCELPSVIVHGARCPWPVCIVDVDRDTVCMSSPYHKHRTLKEKCESQMIKEILQNHTQKGRSGLRLDVSPVRTLEQVRALLRYMDLLPIEESARMGMVDQFMLYLDNMAQAFIAYVKETSEPRSNEKACGAKSARFSLSECRKALDLQHDGLFNAILARAEISQPDISDFIYD